jgi:hypothetical protein
VGGMGKRRIRRRKDQEETKIGECNIRRRKDQEEIELGE